MGKLMYTYLREHVNILMDTPMDFKDYCVNYLT